MNLTPILAGLLAGLTLGVGSLSSCRAEELQAEPIPFSVWLDFATLTRAQPPRVALPIWLESVQSEHPTRRLGESARTIYRLRLRRIGMLNRELQLRVFFDDLPGGGPSISGWTETGSVRFESGMLGNGLGLPSSESVIVPVEETDYLEITAPGDGRSVRGAFVTTAGVKETRTSLDLNRVPPFLEPFGNPWPVDSPEKDSYLLGRTKATLEGPALKLAPEAPGEWAFALDRLPLLAIISFEVLNVDLANPPELVINGAALGPVTPQWPDLADPGYRGEVRPLESDMRFHYTGWLRCQKLVRGSLLKAGTNELRLVLGRQTGPVAIRALELQLKHPSREFDYTLHP